MIALLTTTLPHGQMDGRYKKDGWRDGYFPPKRLSCTRPTGLFGCHPHMVRLRSVIFLDTLAVSDFAAASATRL